jgi:hypothetical protein
MARVSRLEKNDAPWHLRWFYGVMRKMFGKDLSKSTVRERSAHAIDTSRTVARYQICEIQLTAAGQIQFRFNSLDNLLRRSS